MTLSIKPLTTTLLGGVVLLLPLVVALTVVAQGVQLVGHAAAPLIALLPQRSVGGVALASLAALALLLLVCYAAGLLARAALGRKLSESFENKLHALYPRYTVIKGMAQSLRGDSQGTLKAVLVGFDDQEQLAFEVERLADGRVVVFLPGAPDPWTGSVVLVAPQRVQALPVELAAALRCLKGLGLGSAAIFDAAKRRKAAA